MRLAAFGYRSLVYYGRTNLAVVLGAAVGTAALTGALVVGDSVRGSLRDLALGRLGRIDFAMVAPRFFRSELADDLARHAPFAERFDPPCPLVILSGAVKHAEKKTRVNQINVLGVDDRFWAMTADAALVSEPTDRSVILNAALAEELGVAVGEDVLLYLGQHDAIATETLLGRRDEATTTLRLRVAATVPADGLGAFTPSPSKTTPKNAFVPLAVLQRSLKQSGRVNALLVQTKDESGAKDAEQGHELSDALRRVVRLEDFGLRLRENAEKGYVSLESESLLIPPSVEEAAAKLGGKDGRVLTHLANLIRGEGAEAGIPYSTVAAIDPDGWDGRILTAPQGHDPPGLNNGEILLNQWAIDDLGAKVGDRIALSYYVTGAFGKIETRSEAFPLRGVVAMSGIGTDAGFVPEYKGITDTENLADWNPPFPVDLRLVRDKDEAYWDQYKTTPKAFVTLADGQRLWADQAERFGRLTSIRRAFAPEGIGDGDSLKKTSGVWSEDLLRELSLPRMGLVFDPVRQRALAASSGNTDFGMLFIGFSSFLILSSAMLVGLLFRLSVERRSSEFGLLLATGFSPRMVLGVLVGEGAVLALLGGAAGIAAAGGYAWAMLAGLRTWWTAAVNAPFLRLHVEQGTLVIGFFSGAGIAILATVWSVRGLLRRWPRALLSGATGESPWENRGRGKAEGSASILALVAAVASIALSTHWKVLPAALGFFLAGASMLTACLTGLAWRLRAPPRGSVEKPGVVAMARLALRNARRCRGRSLMTAALIGCAAFVILALEAFRLEGGAHTDRQSGAGGYTVYAESVVPLSYDLNTAAGREAMNLSDPALDGTGGFSVTSFRLRAGEESSCLSLYRPNKPRVLGVPQAAITRGGFSFADTLAESDAERANPWTLLERELPDGVIPAIGDEASVKWQLHLDLGKDLVLTGESGREVRLRFVALLRQSVLQNEILIAEPSFVRLFPSVSGYGFFLIESASDRAAAVERALESGLERFGFDAAPTTRRLAEFQAVQNTYLSTFQALGGLGLVLGSAGLAAVMLRNVWERRRELALMRALGFAGSAVGLFVLVENLALVAVGLASAVVSAAVATAPALVQRPAEIPWVSVGVTLGMVLAVATMTCLAALTPMFTVSTHRALRSE